MSKHNGLTRKDIAQYAKVDYAYLTEYLGSLDTSKRSRNDQKKFPSLLSLNLVKVEKHEMRNRLTYLYYISKEGQEFVKDTSKND